jgi:hypothetical protein
MDNYLLVKDLLGLNEGNLPVHKGMRQKRFISIEKMLSLMDVVSRITPKFPLNTLTLDPQDPEWEDDMNYLYPDYNRWRRRALGLSFSYFMYIYNYQIIAHNAHWRSAHKLIVFFMVYYSVKTIFNYRKDVLRANLFDEYVQLRADELIKQRESSVKSESVKKYIWFKLDLMNTLKRCKRQSYINTSEDFKDAELILQDFIRRHTDETQPLPLNVDNAIIGPKAMHVKDVLPY